MKCRTHVAEKRHMLANIKCEWRLKIMPMERIGPVTLEKSVPEKVHGVLCLRRVRSLQAKMTPPTSGLSAKPQSIKLAGRYWSWSFHTKLTTASNATKLHSKSINCSACLHSLRLSNNPSMAPFMSAESRRSRHRSMRTHALTHSRSTE